MGVSEAWVICSLGLDFWKDLVAQHFLATVGITGKMVVSLGVVVFLRQAEGPIEFEALGLKFRGGSGQVVLWLLCVVTLSLCDKLLWPA
jgi:hypothetical protein